ncbi:SCO family protein [Aquimarina litoralis]|uniref:SCO family protein n=1 Tax=Aquimarina litoralis TaxID=584605 RepID=UPI001C56AAB6|nr:SCO family protein [Aquimarina litoralis]MBW1296487.1 SCO family protein [Aquimarina litoralis]
MNWRKKLYSIKGKICFIVLCSLFISCNQEEQKSSRVEVLPYYNDASFTPNWLTPNSLELRNFHKIPSFSFINQLGTEITDKTFQNKIYVTDFFFTTCPGICPKMTSNMLALQEEFRDDNDVLLLSHSVTPEKDSVNILKNYADAKGVLTHKWHLVTGNREDIYNLGRNYYFVEEDLGEAKTNEDFLHTENFVLVDQNKHIRGIYNGLNKTSIAQLIADIYTLKSEKNF